MSTRVDLAPKLAGTTQNYEFDFTSLLADEETISTETVTASVYSGTDAAPSTIINGAASESGGVVTQSIQDGIEGVIYELLAEVTTSESQTLQLTGYLAIIPDLV